MKVLGSVLFAGGLAAGALIYLAGTAYSLIDIPFAERRKRMREVRHGLAPFVLPGAIGGIAPGLLVWARF
jgi:hypothetical protein